MKITTKEEQQQVYEAARKVGGYSELVRLSEEFKRLGKGSKVVRNKDGSWTVTKC